MVLDTTSLNREKINSIKSEPTRFSSFGDISKVSGIEILSPLDHILACTAPTLGERNEAIIHWTQENYGLSEFISAKNEFQSLTGKVFPDDTFYHQRICYFLDYFIYQRPLQGHLRENDRALTPYQAFVQNNPLQSSPNADELIESFCALEHYRHSIFSIDKVNKIRILVQDLFQKDKLEIKKSKNHLFYGFSQGMIFQGFVFPAEFGSFVSQGLIIHPNLANRLIRKSIKKLQSPESSQCFAMLSRFAKQNLAAERHRAKDLKSIYSNDPR